MVAPDICAPCREDWHYNDGDGLDAAGAIALAEALEAEIDAGRTAEFAAETSQSAGQSAGMSPQEAIECVNSNLARHQLPDPKVWHAVCVELGRGPDFVAKVAAFAAFLRDSGGFAIW
jgi:hypothetical protein